MDGYYSKGLTRGVMHLIHLDFKTAADFNKLSFVVFPIIAILWAGALWKELKNLRKRFTPAPSPDQTTPQNEEKPD
ncbi:MAG: DUF2752 domain-containing protein [Bacteroidia bacterium]|nr:DUF2752 domain-containing protein [Bacteroidia bacterium]